MSDSLPQSEDLDDLIQDDSLDESLPQSEPEEDGMAELMGELDHETFQLNKLKERDQMLSKLKQQHQQKETSKKQKEQEETRVAQEEALEELSAIIIKEKTRKLQAEDVEHAAKGRTFKSLDNIEDIITAKGNDKARGFFTIGILVEIQRPFAPGQLESKK